jgi:hypothetical protein
MGDFRKEFFAPYGRKRRASSAIAVELKTTFLVDLFINNYYITNFNTNQLEKLIFD